MITEEEKKKPVEKKSKELRIRCKKACPQMVEIYYENGGEVPAALTGIYTDPKLAEAAIKGYLGKKGRA